MSNYKKDFEHLFDLSGNAMAVLNSKGIFLSANKICEDFCGYSQNKLIAKYNLVNFLAGKNLSEIKGYLESCPTKVRSDVAPATFECKLINSFGYHRIIILSLNWIANDYVFFVTMVDISKIKKVQMQILNTEHKEMIATISSGVTHEVRNSLAPIITSVEILQDSLELIEQDQELMDIICEEVMNLKEIIKEFIQFTRFDEMKLKSIQLNPIINDALTGFKENLQNSVIPKLTLCSDLPNVQVDEGQMKSVISKIIMNAIEAMPKGGELNICTSLYTNQFQEKQIEISIQDNGVGIDETDLTKLFRPFYSHKAEHVGLGLAYCKRILYYHNAEIKIHSEVGKGTKVFIYLPV